MGRLLAVKEALWDGGSGVTRAQVGFAHIIIPLSNIRTACGYVAFWVLVAFSVFFSRGF